MVNYCKHSLLTYFESSSSLGYSTKPQNCIEISRLAQGKPDYWLSLSPVCQFRKKEVILADWWAECWDSLMLSQVKVLLTELLEQGFNLYLWHDDQLKPLGNINYLDKQNYRAAISPEYKDELINKAWLDHKIPQDKVAIIQRAELAMLMGAEKSDLRKINAEYLWKTSHSIKKIQAIEATDPFSFTQAVIRNPYCNQKNKMDAQMQWPHLCWSEEFDSFQYDWFNVPVTFEPHSDREIAITYKALSKDFKFVVPKSITSFYIEAPVWSDKSPELVVTSLITPALRSLTIYDYPGNSTLIPIPARLTNLERLEISAYMIPIMIAISIIKASSCLHTLSIKLNENSVPIDALSDLPLSNLKFLEISGKAQLINLLLQQTPSLASLKFNNTYDLNEEVFRSLILPKLTMIEFNGDITSTVLHALMQAAPNLKHLKIPDKIKGELIYTANFEKIQSLEIDFSQLNILKITPNLEKLILKNVGTLAFDKSISMPLSLESVEIRTITLPTSDTRHSRGFHLYQFLDLVKNIKEVNLQLGYYSCLDTLEVDDYSLAQLSHIPRLSLVLPRLIGNFHNQITLANLHSLSLFGDNSTNRNYIAIHLIQSACQLQRLSIKSKYFFAPSIEILTLPKTLEYLEIEDNPISLQQLKTYLHALPKLRTLIIQKICTKEDFQVWQDDKELQALFNKIDLVKLPSSFISENYIETIIHDEPHLASSKLNRELTCDADTDFDPNKELQATRIFYAADGKNNPSLTMDRHQVFHLLQFQNNDTAKPFLLINTDDNLDLSDEVDCLLVADVYQLNEELLQDNYFGRQTLTISQQWQPIASMTSSDHISHYHIIPKLNVDSYEIKYSNRDNLYYIRYKQGHKKITLHFLVEKLPMRDPSPLNQDIQNEIDDFRDFKPGKLVFDRNPLHPIEHLFEMCKQKKGSCRHRCIAFKYHVERFYKTPVRIVTNNCHTFVEIKHEQRWLTFDLGGYPAKLKIDEASSIQSLSEVTKNDSNNKTTIKPQQQQLFESLLETWQATKLNVENDIILSSLLSGMVKKQLIYIDIRDMNSINMALQAQAMSRNQPIFYVHKPEDLVCSAPIIKRQGRRGYLQTAKNGAGPLNDFLVTKFADDQSPVLIINYNKFKAEEIVKFNALLDPMGLADGTPLPPNISIIGLLDPNQVDVYKGADFYSRFDEIKDEHLRVLPALNPAFQTITSEERLLEPFIIDLCHSLNWQTLLFGGWIVKHGELVFKDGPVTPELLKNKHTILIKNPPNDPMFELFWQQARLRGHFYYAGENYALPVQTEIFISEGYEWLELKSNLSTSDAAALTDHVLNPTKINDFISRYDFDEDELLTHLPGLIEIHALSAPNSSLSLLLTRELNDDQWAMLLYEAQKFNVHLNISCAHDVMLPKHLKSETMIDKIGQALKTFNEAIVFPMSVPFINMSTSLNQNPILFAASYYLRNKWVSLKRCLPTVLPKHQFDNEIYKSWDKTFSKNNQCIITPDPDLTLASINLTQQDIIIDISECNINDLLFRINGELADLTPTFSKQRSALLTALNNNQRVILKGNFSEELLDELAAFIHQRQKSKTVTGQLILLSQRNINFMEATVHKTNFDEKYQLLIKQGFSKDLIEQLEKELGDSCSNEPFTQFQTRLKYLQKHPNSSSNRCWQGLNDLSLSNTNVERFNFRKSKKEAKLFLDERINAFNKALDNEPYVFLAGLTGVGKSRFVENELKNKTLFHGEESILDWIKTSPEDNPILFIDEANLSTKQWSEFEGLFHPSPGILHNGKYYPLSKNHKVVFAGNPLSYGDERQLSPLFKRHGNSLIFSPLSKAFVYETTLKPLLSQTFDQVQMELISENLLEVYDFLIEISTTDVLISPRQLQMMALSVMEYQQRFPVADLKTVAAFHARHLATNLVPKSHLENFNNRFPNIERQSFLGAYETPPIKFKNFYLTPSREKPLWQLTDFLALRDFQRSQNAPLSQHSLGGMHRFVIEGLPGIGKSELLLELVQALGIKEVHLEDELPIDSNHYYRLSASMQASMQEAILLKAFDEGAIVLIDEINSMPTLEKMLNSLLDGKHPKDGNRAPHKAGFRLIGTQNPPSMAGRRISSPALENRSQTIRLPAYPADEMDLILQQKGIHSEATRRELISAYQNKSSEAHAKHLTPAPSFRHFIQLADKVANACHRFSIAKQHFFFKDPNKHNLKLENALIDEQKHTPFSKF